MSNSHRYKQVIYRYLSDHRVDTVFVLLHTKRRDGSEKDLFGGLGNSLLRAECG
jgi:hypothetical protein